MENKDINQEFVNGYLDGYNLDCPNPNDNRHPAYKHSFSIGRAEKLGLPLPSYSVLSARAKIITENCNA